MSYFIFFLIAVLLYYLYKSHQKKKIRKALHFIENYTFPQRVQESVLKTYPHLSETDAKLALKALRDYFYIARQADNHMVSMPSQVVDVAWHEFLLFTALYQKFCDRAFGHYFHHHPTEAMQSQTMAQEGIKRSWKLACLKEKIDPKNPHKLPLLFAIDGNMQIKDGFTYTLNCKNQLKNTHNNSGCAGYCVSDIGCSGISGCVGSDSISHADFSSSDSGGGDSGCSGGCGGS